MFYIERNFNSVVITNSQYSVRTFRISADVGKINWYHLLNRMNKNPISYEEYGVIKVKNILDAILDIDNTYNGTVKFVNGTSVSTNKTLDITFYDGIISGNSSITYRDEDKSFDIVINTTDDGKFDNNMPFMHISDPCMKRDIYTDFDGNPEIIPNTCFTLIRHWRRDFDKYIFKKSFKPVMVDPRSVFPNTTSMYRYRPEGKFRTHYEICDFAKENGYNPYKDYEEIFMMLGLNDD